MTDSVITQFLEREQSRISAFIRLVSPASTEVSAHGGVEFLRGVLNERRDWLVRITGVLDKTQRLSLLGDEDTAGELRDGEREYALANAARDPEFTWLCQLLNAGYYADPGNGWNAEGRSWHDVGWSPFLNGHAPTGVEYRPAREFIVDPSSLEQRYDAVVIGSGAGGGVAACGLAEAGRRVLLIEAGTWPRAAFLATDHLRNPRSTWGLTPHSGAAGPRLPAGL